MNPSPKFTGFEIHPIKRSPIGSTVATGDDEADFFTLYGVVGGDLFAIGDYNTRKDAERCQNSIETTRS